ncbi:MAG: GntR family transcriptional regulator [Myxococcales bacterium]
MVRSLSITVDLASDAPLYRQIRDQIAASIAGGALPPGTRLPTTRALADQLGAHRNTVVRAFEELVAQGLVDSVVGRGSFVASTVTPPPPTTAELPWERLVSRAAGSEPLGRTDRLARDAAGRDLINLSRLQPPDDLLPLGDLRRCMDHALRTHGAAVLGYAPRDGLLRLRAVIARELAGAGIAASPDELVITTGSQQALDLITRGLVDPGDPILIEASTYSGAINLLSAAGARLVAIPSDAEGPDPERLRALCPPGAKAFYLMPNGSNPTGAVVSERRRAELLAWSHEAGVPIIEDDYGADLILDGAPPRPLRALDRDVLYVGTYSKKLIPALRVGFLVCPPPLRQRLVALKHTMDLGTSALLQHALAELLERGLLRSHLRRSLPVYRERRDALDAALREHLPPGIEWARPSQGLLIWLTLPDSLDPELVYARAHALGVAVTPGTLHRVGTRGRGGLRLTFCTEPPDRLREGARRLGEAIRGSMAHTLDTREPTPAFDLV